MAALLTPVLAEIWLALAAMGLLMFGAFRGHRATRTISGLVVASFIVAYILIAGPSSPTTTTFDGLFVVDDFAIFMKLLVLIGAGLTLIMSLGFIRRENMERF